MNRCMNNIKDQSVTDMSVKIKLRASLRSGEMNGCSPLGVTRKACVQQHDAIPKATYSDAIEATYPFHIANESAKRPKVDQRNSNNMTASLCQQVQSRPTV